MNTQTLPATTEVLEFDSAPFEAQLDLWATQAKKQIETVRLALLGGEHGMHELALAMTRSIHDVNNHFQSGSVASWNSAAQREQKNQAKRTKITEPMILKLVYVADEEKVEVQVADAARTTEKDPVLVAYGKRKEALSKEDKAIIARFIEQFQSK